jgi:hypothetical protein
MVLVIPGSEISFRQYEHARSVISQSASSTELDRLAQTGAVPLVLLRLDTAAKTLEVAHAVAIDSVIASMNDIKQSNPVTLHAWDIPGRSKVDRMALVYDGREAGEDPRLWLLPSAAFLEPRLNAISSYYYLTGLSGLVWMIGALFVHMGHARRKGH